MARYGTWKPLASNWEAQPRIARYDLLIFHTMVGSLWGTDGYFRKDGYGGSESHWGVGYDGECLQWQDTTRQADASGAANVRSLSVETADTGTGFAAWTGSNVPAWTPKQLDRLVDLTVWCCKTHNIPCVLVPDSKPGRRGIAYHRLGVPGYAIAGGELWSSARGKVCPGDRRILQVPTIVQRAAAILGGQSATPVVTPIPTTTTGGLPMYMGFKEGDTGDRVLHMQSWFKRMFSYAKTLDLGPRRYGPQTRGIIKEFQKRVNITGSDADGTIIGPRTMTAMVKLGYRE